MPELALAKGFLKLFEDILLLGVNSYALID